MNKRHTLVIAVAALGLVLTGCGAKDTSAKNAVGNTAATQLTAANFVTELTAAQSKAKSGHVDMKIDASGQKITAVGDISVGATAADTKVAMKMDPMSQNKFAKIDLTNASNPIGAQFGKIIDQLDPTKQIEQFKVAMKSMQKKGNAIELDGVKAQPYVITLDSSRIPAVSQLGSVAKIPKEIVYTMFIGPDNLPRRITSEVSGATVSMDYTKWGESVDIAVPSKSEITDQNLLKQMGTHTAG